jgi:hypothetical protein
MAEPVVAFAAVEKAENAPSKSSRIPVIKLREPRFKAELVAELQKLGHVVFV